MQSYKKFSKFQNFKTDKTGGSLCLNGVWRVFFAVPKNSNKKERTNLFCSP